MRVGDYVCYHPLKSMRQTPQNRLLWQEFEQQCNQGFGMKTRRSDLREQADYKFCKTDLYVHVCRERYVVAVTQLKVSSCTLLQLVETQSSSASEVTYTFRTLTASNG